MIAYRLNSTPRRLARLLWPLACTLLALGAAPLSAQPADPPFTVEPVADFDEPWAMTFLPDGRLLVTEKTGKLQLFNIANGSKVEISGVPAVFYGGQGGFGDVLLHPDFNRNGIIYVSYAEPGDNDTGGAAVARARLDLDERGGNLEELEVIWRQVPKVEGQGHFGLRLAFGPDGMLWITSSERQKFKPAQDMSSHLGKIVRLQEDGTPPADNPFAEQGEVAAEIWSLGHRNMLGIAFDASGQLWAHEMGPAGGDELNLIKRGQNYGYPAVSEGRHYSGKAFPASHSERADFVAPVITWTPVISPAGFVIYSGELFPDWQGHGLIGGLSSQALIRVEFDGEQAREVARYDMGARIREVEQGADGHVWLLEDEQSGSRGRLLKICPH